MPGWTCSQRQAGVSMRNFRKWKSHKNHLFFFFLLNTYCRGSGTSWARLDGGAYWALIILIKGINPASRRQRNQNSRELWRTSHTNEDAEDFQTAYCKWNGKLSLFAEKRRWGWSCKWSGSEDRRVSPSFILCVCVCVLEMTGRLITVIMDINEERRVLLLPLSFSFSFLSCAVAGRRGSTDYGLASEWQRIKAAPVLAAQPLNHLFSKAEWPTNWFIEEARSCRASPLLQKHLRLGFTFSDGRVSQSSVVYNIGLN